MKIKTNKSSRSGRYRKLLITPSELLPFAANLEAFFSNLQQKRLRSEMGDAEFLSYGLLSLLACRRDDAFQKNPGLAFRNNAQKQSNIPFADFIALLEKHNLPIKAFKKFSDMDCDVFEYLNRIRFRGIPDTARQALLQWLDKKYPLHLFLYIPTVNEVFNMQKWGGRCVTFFMQSSDITKLHHERDVISFIVHDLIHANEFYANQIRAKQQIGFYQWLDEIKEFTEIQELTSRSTGFQERWDYLLSDMNSYCGHLLKTLHAAIIIHVPDPDNQMLWKKIIDKSNLTTTERNLFFRINAPDWKDEEYYQLEKVFEKKAASHADMIGVK